MAVQRILRLNVLHKLLVKVIASALRREVPLVCKDFDVFL